MHLWAGRLNSGPRPSSRPTSRQTGSETPWASCWRGLTQQQLADRTGIPRRHISDMEHGRRPIGKANARKLAAALKLNPRLLLSV
ncbi:MAG: helix-turn-helix transcriptional regulator [Thermodesulfobacteriota bacterium]